MIYGIRDVRIYVTLTGSTYSVFHKKLLREIRCCASQLLWLSGSRLLLRRALLSALGVISSEQYMYLTTHVVHDPRGNVYKVT